MTCGKYVFPLCISQNFIKPYLVENAAEKSPLFVDYIYYVLPLILFTLLFNLFDTYYRVLYNALKGIFYKEVVQRILVLITICLFYFEFFLSCVCVSVLLKGFFLGSLTSRLLLRLHKAVTVSNIYHEPVIFRDS